ncbi:MAG TPA: M50 family metallopeptidase, partial [Acidimicrobiales bacterium]|nr:M50 family metallopeptidase [Acidimicrobiales bacterium]
MSTSVDSPARPVDGPLGGPDDHGGLPPADPGASPTPGGEGPSTRPNLWGFVRLAVAVAAVVAVFLAAGLGALLVVIVAIIVMVMVHELGHFATAKWSRMKVTEYFVGFGPRLWSVRRGETEYGVKAIPAGGYVKIPGMSHLEEIDPATEARTYRQQPFHKRIIVACAGSFMHLLMALILAWVAVVAFGVANSSTVQVAGFVKWDGHTQTAAQQAGLRSGDRILSVDGRSITTPGQLSTAIEKAGGSPVVLGVKTPAGRRTTVTVTPQAGHVDANGHEVLGAGGTGKTDYVIGVSTDGIPLYTSEGPVRAVGTATVDLGRVVTGEAAGLAHVFSPSGLGAFFSQVTSPQKADQAASNPTSTSSERLTSIVGAARVATQAEQEGVLYLLEVLITLNIAFAVLNMLPMLPLDGGHVAIAIYERIRTRKG